MLTVFTPPPSLIRDMYKAHFYITTLTFFMFSRYL